MFLLSMKWICSKVCPSCKSLKVQPKDGKETRTSSLRSRVSFHPSTEERIYQPSVREFRSRGTDTESCRVESSGVYREMYLNSLTNMQTLRIGATENSSTAESFNVSLSRRKLQPSETVKSQNCPVNIAAIQETSESDTIYMPTNATLLNNNLGGVYIGPEDYNFEHVKQNDNDDDDSYIQENHEVQTHQPFQDPSQTFSQNPSSPRKPQVKPSVLSRLLALFRPSASPNDQQGTLKKSETLNQGSPGRQNQFSLKQSMPATVLELPVKRTQTLNHRAD